MTQATATAPRPAITVDHPNRPPGGWSTIEVAAEVGIHHQKLFRWVHAGLVTPSIDCTPGPGPRWWWSEGDVELLRQVAARLDWGMTVRGAFRTDTPPPLEVR